jgi:hypothetical protein
MKNNDSFFLLYGFNAASTDVFGVEVRFFGGYGLAVRCRAMAQSEPIATGSQPVTRRTRSRRAGARRRRAPPTAARNCRSIARHQRPI